MSDFKAKMHKIRFPLGLCPRPSWGGLTALPHSAHTPWLYLSGPTCRGDRGRRRGGEELGKVKGRGREVRGVEGGPRPPPIFWLRTAPENCICWPLYENFSRQKLRTAGDWCGNTIRSMSVDFPMASSWSRISRDCAIHMRKYFCSVTAAQCVRVASLPMRRCCPNGIEDRKPPATVPHKPVRY